MDMHGKMRYLIIFLLLIVASCQAKVIVVDQSGSGDAKTLFTAISLAENGDTIQILEGNYSGATVDRRLTIIGSNATIHGPLVIAALGCEITDLTVDASGIDPAIDLRSQNNQLRRCTIRGRTTGLVAASGNNSITECQIDSPLGLELLGARNKIANSTVRSNVGIKMNSTSGNLISGCEIAATRGVLMDDSSGNRILNNTFSGIGFGVVLTRSNGNEISGNNISGAYVSCLDMADSSRNNITGNCVTGGKIGISLRMSEENNVTRNICYRNERAGIYGDKASKNHIESNQLFENGNGILISGSVDSIIKFNNASRNAYGISIRGSPKNILSDNTMRNNSYNLRVDAGEASSSSMKASSYDFFVQEIDSTNLVDGKPVYYLIDKDNLTVPSGCGFLGLVSCRNILAENMNISNSSIGILLVNSTNCRIQNSSISRAETGAYLLDCNESNVKNCRVTSCKSGFVALRQFGGRFEKDVAGNCSFEGFRADNAQDLLLIGCHVEFCKSGISLHRSSLCIVQNCSTNKNKEEGILLTLSHKCRLLFNEAFSNDRGISLSGSNACVLDGNNASRNKRDGITLEQLSIADVLNNTAKSNGQGIYVQSAKELELKTNILSMNSRYGLRMSNSVGCNVTENSLSNNQIAGVNLVDCTNNLLYHNIFANNVVQNVADNGNNHWDAGPKIGGNYWSDFAVFGNPGNVSRQIPGNGVDQYPFQDPGGWN
jgi:parallel beta-helix repeat protein